MKTSFLLLIIITLFQSCGKKVESIDQRFLLEEDREIIPYLQNESDALTFFKKGMIVKMEDERFTNIEVSYLKEKELNHLHFDLGLRVVAINSLFLKLGNSKTSFIKNNFDIKRLTVTSKIVEISEPLYLPSTDIEIYAEEIHFKGKGKIITTPLEKESPAKLFEDGKIGLQGGSVKIIGKIINEEEGVVRIITTGGKGENAGPGEDGLNGENARVVKDNYYYEKYEQCTWEGSDRKSINVFELMSWDCNWRERHGSPSQNGGDAKIGGAPGEGGEAGDIVLSQKFYWVENKNGKPGDEDKLRVGGNPGSPERTCRGKTPRGRGTETYDCVVAKKGQDAKPQKTEYVERLGLVSISDESFITSDYLKNLLQYADALYLENDLEGALKIYENIEANLNQREEESFTFLNFNLQKRFFNLYSRLDYYGHEKTWAPNLAFDINYKIFEKEMHQNLKNLYLSKTLFDRSEELVSRLDKVRELKENLIQEINFNKGKVRSLISNLKGFENELKNLEKESESFEERLREKEEELYSRALSQNEYGLFKKSLKVLSVASKAIPVGQPSFSFIGVASDLLDKVLSNELKVEDIRDFSIAYETSDFSQAFSELNDKLDNLDPRNIKDLKVYLKESREFLWPIYEAFKNQKDYFRDNSIDNNKLRQALSEIKRKDQSFKVLVSKVDELMTRRKELIKKIQMAGVEIQDSLSFIEEGFNKLQILSNEDLELSLLDGSKLSNVLNKISETSLERLRYYHYFFSKAYEYRMLEHYESVFNYEAILNKIYTLHKNTALSLDEKIETLVLFFKSELSTILGKVLDNLNRDGFSHQRIETYKFTKSEEEALNRGEEITIDLRGFYSLDKKDIRVNSMRLNQSYYSNSTNLEFEFKVAHSGMAFIEKGEKAYVFTYSSHNNPNLTWLSYKNIRSNALSYSTLEQDEKNLLISLLGVNPSSTLLTKPGGRAHFKVKLLKPISARVVDLALDIDYSFKL